MNQACENLRMLERTGHSRRLRSRLIDARTSKGWSQEYVASRIVKDAAKGKTYSGATLSLWENFHSHPPVDVMAQWARVVGLRLIVDLDDAAGDQVPVLVPADYIEPVRALVDLDDEARRLAALFIGAIDKMSPELRMIAEGSIVSWDQVATMQYKVGM